MLSANNRVANHTSAVAGYLIVARNLFDVVFLVTAGLALLAAEGAEVRHVAAAELREVDAAKVTYNCMFD